MALSPNGNFERWESLLNSKLVRLDISYVDVSRCVVALFFVKKNKKYCKIYRLLQLGLVV